MIPTQMFGYRHIIHVIFSLSCLVLLEEERKTDSQAHKIVLINSPFCAKRILKYSIREVIFITSFFLETNLLIFHFTSLMNSYYLDKSISLI